MPSLRTNMILATAVLCLVSNGLMSCTRQSPLLAPALADHDKDYASLSGKLAKDMTEKGAEDWEIEGAVRDLIRAGEGVLAV